MGVMLVGAVAGLKGNRVRIPNRPAAVSVILVASKPLFAPARMGRQEAYQDASQKTCLPIHRFVFFEEGKDKNEKIL